MDQISSIFFFKFHKYIGHNKKGNATVLSYIAGDNQEGYHKIQADRNWDRLIFCQRIGFIKLLTNALSFLLLYPPYNLDM